VFDEVKIKFKALSERVAAVEHRSQGAEQKVAREDVAVSGSSSLIAVVQTTDLTHRHDRPDCGRLNRA
jgi:hypothetical protein